MTVTDSSLLPLDTDLRLTVSEEANTDEALCWLHWKSQRDLRARDKLIHIYIPYARMLSAKLYGRRITNEFEFDDYLQFASVGLIEAIDRYIPEHGTKFTTYASARIEGAILSGLERMSDRQQQISLHSRLKKNRLENIEEDLIQHPAELLLNKLADIGIGLALGIILEGNGMVHAEESSLPDLCYERMEVKQLRARLLDCLLQMSNREQEVLRMHYLHEITFEEISRLLSITKGRVSQIHKQALIKLRALLSKPEYCDVRY